MHESYEFIINYILQTADIVNHVESGRNANHYDYQNMIKNKFEWISKEEEKDGMQLPLNVIVTNILQLLLHYHFLSQDLQVLLLNLRVIMRPLE